MKPAPPFPVVLIAVWAWSVPPAGVWAYSPGVPSSRSQEQTAEAPESASAPSVERRFRLEVYGGGLAINPGDLNLFPAYADRLQAAEYDDLLRHLEETNAILDWTRSQTGEREELTRGVALGMRIKVLLSERFGLSLGFKFLSSRRGQDLYIEYARSEFDGYENVERLEYTPFSISAQAYIPSAGLHLMGVLNRTSRWEIFVNGGPVIAECRFLSDWSYAWTWRSGASDFPVFSSRGTLEQRGRGTGLALEAGARVSAPLGSRWDLFFEGAYAYQVVDRISGTGREIVDEYRDEWEGDWVIRSETVEFPWTAVDLTYPTNFRTESLDEEHRRAFELDLSGFQIRIGLSLKF